MRMRLRRRGGEAEWSIDERSEWTPEEEDAERRSREARAREELSARERGGMLSKGAFIVSETCAVDVKRPILMMRM